MYYCYRLSPKLRAMKLIITSLLLAFMPSVFAAPTTTATTSIITVPEWGQCGGIPWTGPTTCAPGLTCVYSTAYVWQCLSIGTSSTSAASLHLTTTTTSTTTTSATVITAPEWAQCAGIGWTGPTVCAPGLTCVYENAYHSQCLVVSTTSTSTAPTSTTTITTTTVITAPEWAQCGGIGFTGPTVCAPGLTCVYENAWFSQCFITSTTSISAASTPTVTTKPKTTTTTRGY